MALALQVLDRPAVLGRKQAGMWLMMGCVVL